MRHREILLEPDGVYKKTLEECMRVMSKERPSLPKSKKLKRLPKRKPCLPRSSNQKRGTAK